MVECNQGDPVSRRSVCKTAGVVFAGTPLLATRATARTGERFRFEIEEATETTITVRVIVSAALVAHLREVPSQIVLGHRDQFSLGGDVEAVADEYEDSDVATPDTMASFKGPHSDRYIVTMQFRTREIDFSEAEIEDGTLTIGLCVPRPGPSKESVVVTDEIESGSVGVGSSTVSR